jgi:uncharacterized protein YjbJ (UPF0337 family)
MARALIGAPTVTGSAAGLRRKEPDVGLGKRAKTRVKIMKGKARKHAGQATGNKRLRAKGKAGEVAGKLKLKGEKAKGAFKR